MSVAFTDYIIGEQEKERDRLISLYLTQNPKATVEEAESYVAEKEMEDESYRERNI